MRKPYFEIGAAIVFILSLFIASFYFNFFNFSTTKCSYQGVAPSFQNLELSTSIISPYDTSTVSWITRSDTDIVRVTGTTEVFFFAGKTQVQSNSLKIVAINSSCETTIEKRFLFLPIQQVTISFLLIFLLLITYSLYLVLRSQSSKNGQDSFFKDAFNATSVVKPLGVVIDYRTSTPITGAIVRLYDATKKNLLMTAVTNTNGEFSMSVDAGNYFFEISKEGYTPIDKNSAILQNQSILTAEQVFFVPEKTSSLAVTLSMQPESAKGNTGTNSVAKLGSLSLQRIWMILLATVLFTQLLFIILNPIAINIFLVFGIALLFIVIYRREFRPQEASGYLIDGKGKPLAGVEIGLFDSEFRVLLGQTFTDASGQFFLEWTTQQNTVLQLLDIRYVFENNERSTNIKQYATTKQGSKVVTGVYKTKPQLSEY